jgi:hypothetical protein
VLQAGWLSRSRRAIEGLTRGLREDFVLEPAR